MSGPEPLMERLAEMVPEMVEQADVVHYLRRRADRRAALVAPGTEGLT